MTIIIYRVVKNLAFFKGRRKMRNFFSLKIVKYGRFICSFHPTLTFILKWWGDKKIFHLHFPVSIPKSPPLKNSKCQSHLNPKNFKHAFIQNPINFLKYWLICKIFSKISHFKYFRFLKFLKILLEIDRRKSQKNIQYSRDFASRNFPISERINLCNNFYQILRLRLP